jgi:peptidyl-tRNA hydrolase
MNWTFQMIFRDEIEAKAKQAGIVTYLVLDAGRTQVASGSKTVLAVGPGTVHNTNTYQITTQNNSEQYILLTLA